MVKNSRFLTDYLEDGTEVCIFKDCVNNYTGDNCEIAPECTGPRTCSCTPSQQNCIDKAGGSAAHNYVQSCNASGKYDDCSFWMDSDLKFHKCSEFNSC